MDPTQAAELIARIRLRQELTRGQVARRLGVTPTIIFNIETGRSRIRLRYFFAYLELARLDPAVVLSRHLQSIKAVTADPAALVHAFRTRLKWSQKEMAARLGFRGGAIVHHFEKGLREPDLEVFLRLMTLARDNVRGLVLETTGDAAFAAGFPEGHEPARSEQREYWTRFQYSAIRQLMRTRAYRDLPRYEPGYFAEALGLTLAEEREALDVLKRSGIVRWEGGKPIIDPGVRIVIPQNIPRETLDQVKCEWLAFGRDRYLAGNPETLFSVDALPADPAFFQETLRRIRDLQDETHSRPVGDAEGFVSLTWIAAYVPAPKTRRPRQGG